MRHLVDSGILILSDRQITFYAASGRWSCMHYTKVIGFKIIYMALKVANNQPFWTFRPQNGTPTSRLNLQQNFANRDRKRLKLVRGYNLQVIRTAKDPICTKDVSVNMNLDAYVPLYLTRMRNSKSELIELTVTLDNNSNFLSQCARQQPAKPKEDLRRN